MTYFMTFISFLIAGARSIPTWNCLLGRFARYFVTTAERSKSVGTLFANAIKRLSFVTLLGLGVVNAQDADPALGVTVRSFASSTCTDTFIKHSLNHTTQARGDEVTFYDSNGAGLALGDLNQDGLIDMVLANLKGKNSIFWNEGGLEFRREAMSHGDSRAANIVDVNGDGWLDLVFTQNLGGLSYWQNGTQGLEPATLAGVTVPAYTMAWADLDRDGDVDLVTASYDTHLEKELKDSFLFSNGAGVVVYEQNDGQFSGTRLAETSQALALTLFDVNADGKLDILVGNDFEVPDYTFINSAAWREAAPFTQTTRNTMSFASADINNDGLSELLATDMKPDFNDARALAAWTPLMQKSYERKTQAANQLEENMLYAPRGAGYQNLGARLGLDATGWSWSGKFGDLDNNGLLDLYVVNGMIARELFEHLPNFELVEENQVFRQTERGFEKAAWNLNAAESGRGMSMADLDNDGDLDIVVNNLESPATLFENQVCGGESVELDLLSDTENTRALGAKVTLETSHGSLLREVSSSSGYLSGDSARLHFGFPANATLNALKIVWPDGAVSELAAPEADTLVTVTRLTNTKLEDKP